MIRRLMTPLRFAFRTTKQFHRPFFYSCRTWRNFSTEKNQDDPMKNIKEEGQKFYENHVDNIVDLQSLEDWQSIMTQSKTPIIVDLYADWCEPCKKLTPKLQERVKEATNVRLLKVNIDKFPQIAQALQVKSVPTVYLIYGKQAVDGFQGAVADEELDRFFSSIKRISEISAGQMEAISILDQSRSLIEEKKIDEAIELLEKFPENTKQKDAQAIKEIFLAQCYLSVENYSKFKQTMLRVEQHKELYKNNEHINKLYEILQDALEKINEQISGNPQILNLKKKIQAQGKLQDKFALAQLYKTNDMMEQSLQTALQIIKENKNWEDKKANKFVLNMFKEMGNTSPLTQKYRKIFQRLLN